MFLITVNVLGHPKGVRGLTSYFLRGGGMDVFWNDPISHFELYAFMYHHPSVSLNNEKICHEISENKIAVCEKTQGLRAGTFRI